MSLVIVIIRPQWQCNSVGLSDYIQVSILMMYNVYTIMIDPFQSLGSTETDIMNR